MILALKENVSTTTCAPPASLAVNENEKASTSVSHVQEISPVLLSTKKPDSGASVSAKVMSSTVPLLTFVVFFQSHGKLDAIRYVSLTATVFVRSFPFHVPRGPPQLTPESIEKTGARTTRNVMTSDVASSPLLSATLIVSVVVPKDFGWP